MGPMLLLRFDELGEQSNRLVARALARSTMIEAASMLGGKKMNKVYTWPRKTAQKAKRQESRSTTARGSAARLRQAACGIEFPGESRVWSCEAWRGHRCRAEDARKVGLRRSGLGRLRLGDRSGRSHHLRGGWGHAHLCGRRRYCTSAEARQRLPLKSHRVYRV
mmetsp:Transcript_24394/g.55529  ORF Transcript_24394/g.55529 Transcript_24394/m.55529 type:complete len:164 (-) Transcript_24394:1448-1939(-)